MPISLTRVIRVQRTGSTDLQYPPNGASSGLTCAVGDLVSLDVNGRVTQAGAVGANLVAAVRFGVANEAITAATQGANLGVEKLDDDTLIELPVTAADVAIATPATTAPTLIGKQFEVRRVTTSGIYTVDSSATTNVKVEVVALGNTFPTSDNFATVICKVLAGARLN